MKKHYLTPLFLLLFLPAVKAEVIIVEVTNNQFSPANIPNVIVGDTIRYNFIQGFHNATSEGVTDALPSGAPAINSGAPSGSNPRSFDYIVTTAGNYKYLCEVHADAVSFTGMVGTFTASVSLPAVLKDFNITTSKNKPLFTWRTLTEINVSHFSLRSSYDGFKYNEVGKVTASGNSVNEQAYNFTDNTVSNKYKFVYYLLAVVDKDGRESLSKVMVFKNPIGSPKLITQLGPNPIKRPGQMTIQFNSEKEGRILARVFDANGKMVLQTYMSAFPGLNNGHIHMCDLSAGTYTIQFTLDGIKENKKVIVY